LAVALASFFFFTALAFLYFIALALYAFVSFGYGGSIGALSVILGLFYSIVELEVVARRLARVVGSNGSG